MYILFDYLINSANTNESILVRGLHKIASWAAVGWKALIYIIIYSISSIWMFHNDHLVTAGCGWAGMFLAPCKHCMVQNSLISPVGPVSSIMLWLVFSFLQLKHGTWRRFLTCWVKRKHGEDRIWQQLLAYWVRTKTWWGLCLNIFQWWQHSWKFCKVGI